MNKYESYDHTSSSAVLTEGYVNSSSGSVAVTVQPVTASPVNPYPANQAYPTDQILVNSVGNQLAVQGDNRNPRPLPATWKDGICDWPKNLYPSCYCTTVCYGIYIIAQMAEKLQHRSFKATMISFVCIWITSIVLEYLLPGSRLQVYVPFFYVVSMSIGLRLYIVFKENISTNGGACCEACLGFWCFPCSVAQMARHIYGYTKIFDGDGDIERGDNYAHTV